MKKCFKCKETKPLSEFYAHSQMADGHLNKCKTCAKTDAYNRRHFSDSRERILAYDRVRGNRQAYDYVKNYRINSKEKYTAHQVVARLVNNGKLIKQPCCVCGSVVNIHAHHDDYSKPEMVRWLCAEHHRQWHAQHDFKIAS